MAQGILCVFHGAAGLTEGWHATAVAWHHATHHFLEFLQSLAQSALLLRAPLHLVLTGDTPARLAKRLVHQLALATDHFL